MMGNQEQLEAVTKGYVSEAEIGSQLMMAAINDGDWPYVAGLIVMGKSYAELSSHPDIQKFIRETCAEWGEKHSHEEWAALDHRETLRAAARAVREYNKTKDGVTS